MRQSFGQPGQPFVGDDRDLGLGDRRDIMVQPLQRVAVQIEEIPALRGVQELGDVARPDRSGEWAIASGLSLYPLNAARRAPRQRAEAAA